MFICPTIKVVFLAIPKTGTRSIYHMFKNTYGGYVHKEHEPIIPKQYESFFSFCVVRNPYDRACSAYWSMCQRKSDRSGFLKRFELDGIPNTIDSFMLHYQKMPNKRFTYPQNRYYTNNRIDQVLRFETLQEDFNTLPFLDGPVELPFSNSTTTNRTQATPATRPPWEDLITPVAGQIINDLYSEDFKLFNYPMRKFI